MKPNETKSRGRSDKKLGLRDRFIMALLGNPSVEAAAQAVGISRVTAWRWMQDAALVQRLTEVRRQSMAHARMRLQAAASRSVDCLCAVQQNGENESAKVSAAVTFPISVDFASRPRDFSYIGRKSGPRLVE
jgi:hypothetical protein